MKNALVIASTLAITAAAPTAVAHNPGDFVVRAGFAQVSPNDSSSQISVNGTGIGGRATVGADTQLGLTLAYKLSDHLGIELLAATPFKHRVGLSGLGDLNGKLGEVKQLPPTLSLQYYPLAPTSRWQPYVGAGVNYTTFFTEKLTSERQAQGWSNLKLSDSWGLAAQVGSDWMITDRLMINAAVWYMDIDTNASARLGGAQVRTKVDINPWVVMVGLGYRF
jgi:outer membrane protein